MAGVVGREEGRRRGSGETVVWSGVAWIGVVWSGKSSRAGVKHSSMIEVSCLRVDGGCSGLVRISGERVGGCGAAEGHRVERIDVVVDEGCGTGFIGESVAADEDLGCLPLNCFLCYCAGMAPVVGTVACSIPSASWKPAEEFLLSFGLSLICRDGPNSGNNGSHPFTYMGRWRKSCDEVGFSRGAWRQ